MPATVLVTESIIRKSRQHFRRAGRSIFAFLVAITHQPVGERDIEPARAVSIRVEGDAVWITQTAQEFRHLLELPRGWIKLIEDVDHSTTIVGEVEHVRDEQTFVRAHGHEANALQTLRRNADLITVRQVKIE